VTRTPLKLLILDENVDGRARLVRTLLRKFPKAVVLECRDAASAATMSGSECVDFVLVHRAWDMDGDKVLRVIRKAAPDVPVLILSATRHMLDPKLGNVRFLDYDQWLLAGNVVEEMIRAKPKRGD
jgi:DNA-binding response OmpR family regulator